MSSLWTIMWLAVMNLMDWQLSSWCLGMVTGPDIISEVDVIILLSWVFKNETTVSWRQVSSHDDDVRSDICWDSARWTSRLHAEVLDRWVEQSAKLISLSVSLLWCMLGNRMCRRCLTRLDVSRLSGIGLLPLPRTDIKADWDPLTRVSSHRVMFPRPPVQRRRIPPRAVSRLTHWGHDEDCTLTPRGVTQLQEAVPYVQT